MALKWFIAFLMFGFVTMPIFSKGSFVTPTTAIFLIGLTALGVHFAQKAKEMSMGNRALSYFYRSTPLVMPLAALMIRQIMR